MSEPFLAQITLFAATFAPRGWALCEGQILPISQNQALFSLLGTTYGGDGRTTFALPDLRGRAPMHPGSGSPSSFKLGQKGGIERVTLTPAEIPAHTHTLAPRCSSTGEDDTSPTGRFPGPSPNDIYANAPAAGQNLGPLATSNAGGSQAHENMQPFLAVGFIIAIQGTFPSRN